MKPNNLKILVIGCSKLGASIASKASNNGSFVSIIDKDESAFIKLDPSYSGYTFEGDGTEIQILEKARVGEVDEVDIVTDDDDTNIFIASLISHYYNSVSSIIVRLSDESKSVLLESKKIKIISPYNLAMKQYDKVKEDK